MLPVLRLCADRKPHSLAEMRDRIATELELSEDDLAERQPSGEKVFANRIRWAAQFLKQAAVLNSVRRGVYRIADRGLALLKEKPSEVTKKMLSQYPEFIEFDKKAPARSPVTTTPASETKATPEESLERSYQVLRAALASELLETVKDLTPAAFEKIVVDLLVAMGYGGSVEDAGKVVGKSGDGGIDGIIKQDKLGLDFLYVQAKRWNDVVGRPEVMKFSGSLTKKHAIRGVFITTSMFTKDALEYVEEMQSASF
ncbi:MAG: restriction endonuclease [Bryobacteraceae bacterium]